MAQEAATVAETLAYEWGVQETETRLTAEVTAVCREYCDETYSQALNRARIPTNSDLRRMDQVYYLEDLRENLTPPPPIPLPPPNEPLPTQKYSQDSELPIGAEKRKGRKRRRRKLRRRRRRRKRSRIKLMPTPPRMPLPLGIWSPRLKLLDPSLRLIPRRILSNHRLRYRILALPDVFVMTLCF